MFMVQNAQGSFKSLPKKKRHRLILKIATYVRKEQVEI